ncbi:uncharacterized protein LOC128783762 [Vidua chalybeata]|uniref:uncharacterized protein LOC128783762 n=1 Tax=Vidua chalybeata TaxID=81927 RepID=UPI0023A7AE37|nr:uncharacterized protein LOC128783762 [Vidua chalybeata]
MNTEGEPLCGLGAAPSPLRCPQALRRELEAAVWARGGALAPQVPSGALSPGGGGISKPLFPPLSARRRAGSHARARRRPQAAPGVRQRRNGRLPSRVFTVFCFAGGRDEKPWDDEARASWRSGVFELKSGTARQERAGGAASSSSRVERRGKSKLQHWQLAAQDWNSEAQGVELLRPERVIVHWQKPWDDEARAAASSSSRVERRGKSQLGAEEGPGGALWAKGFSRPGHLQGAAAGFAPGALPVCRAGSLLWSAFCRRAPLAARREGQRCKEGESPCLRTWEGKRSSPGPQPGYPVSRAGLFPSPGSFLPAAGPWPA